MSTERGALEIIRQGLRLTPGFKQVIATMLGVGTLLGMGRVAIPVMFQQIFDRGLLADGGLDRPVLARLIFWTTLILVTTVILSYITQMVMVRLAERALSQLRVLVLRRIVDLTIAEHATERQGNLVSVVTGDLETLSRFLDWGAYTWLVSPSMVLIAVVVMFVYSWILAIVTIVILAGMLPVLQWLQRRQQRGFGQVRERTGELLADVGEIVGGAEVIRAFGQQDATADRLEGGVEALYRSQLKVNRSSAVLFTVSDIFGSFAICAVIAMVVWIGPDTGVGLGEAIAFLFLVQLILNPLAELTEVIDQTSLALAGWNRAIDIALRPPAIPEPAQPVLLPAGPLEVRASGVSFSYGDHRVLTEIDLEIPAGTSMAIVGTTGSGKTTFARLLCRLADVDAGEISLGGVDLRSASADDRRASVRMVPQDGFLFATTVRDNVSRGRHGTTDADIDQVVADLGLRDWVARLPDGLDTVLGPGGDGLSVGERQLVALIRAGLADPGLLILDEATSSLDPATERAMSDALVRISEGRTTVTVAHRLSTAERADAIAVFSGGRIVEQGTHHELLDLGGAYTRLHDAWTHGVDALSDPA